MRIKGLQDEDFVNYKFPSMFIGTCFCDWKCCIEGFFPIETCQNYQIMKQPNITLSDEEIYQRYINNPITSAIVIGGLEPIIQFDEILSLIDCFRSHECNDDFVIYTGYYPKEIVGEINRLKRYKNIVIKFGRYLNNNTPIFDETLGVLLATNNQWGERIS